MRNFDLSDALSASAGDPQAVDKLISQLGHDDEGDRLHAAEFLGVSQDLRAVEPLIGLLRDEAPAVRAVAASALANLGDRRAVGPLVEALRDPAWGVYVRSAVRALGNLGDRTAVGPLIAALAHEHLEVRASAAAALAKLGDAAAIGPLIDVLVGVGPRALASTALSEFGTSAAGPLIGLVAHPDKDVRFYAADALSRIRDDRSVGALASLLSDSHVIVRKKATQALVNIGSPAVPRLIQSLGETSQGVRLAACEALGLIGDGQAIEPLKRLLEDQDEVVVESAAKSLAMLGE